MKLKNNIKKNKVLKEINIVINNYLNQFKIFHNNNKIFTLINDFFFINLKKKKILFYF
jgi:hypothetical protein